MRRAWISVVVPVLNEETCIARFIERMRDELVSSISSWEIVVVDDGSTDRTREIVGAYARADDRVRLVADPHRGKGAAVRRGMLAAVGEWRFMADADLSMPPDNLARFVAAAQAAPAPDVVIASREAPGARRVGEPWQRHAAGRLFNWIVRLLALPGIRDTQCGYKLLSARAAEALAPRLTIDGFAFDVELLVLARRAGLDIREVGIEWHARRDGRVDVRRGAAAFVDILRIRWRQARQGCAIWAYLLAVLFPSPLEGVLHNDGVLTTVEAAVAADPPRSWRSWSIEAVQRTTPEGVRRQ